MGAARYAEKKFSVSAAAPVRGGPPCTLGGEIPTQNCATRTRMLMMSPIQEPKTPAWDRNASSSTEWPWICHARRKRMCARQMEPQVKIEESPLRACIQRKALSSELEAARNARNPTADESIMENTGRPLRSMYAKIFGACFCSARAVSVREEPYTDEFPTESTAIMMTTFITESRPWIPALNMAMTNGDAFASEFDDPVMRRFSLKGTKRPTRVNETM